ncbi:MAG: response regulator [Betaproteobacteria bacterium]|nr:response regulator [Betaproteobacteria bacterium]
MTRTILLVDDSEHFRESAAWLLESLGYAVRAFDSPAGFLQALDGIEPGCAACVLLDMRMPGLSGLQVHDALIARGATWPVVYMTGHGDVPLAVEAMQKGAYSFLEKPFQDSVLERTLEQAFERAGRMAAAPAPVEPARADAAIVADDEGDEDPAAQAHRARLASLTPRERQVLDLVIAGLLNKTIGDRLGISIKTVELHRSRVMQKMGARSFAELMRGMLTHGGVAA